MRNAAILVALLSGWLLAQAEPLTQEPISPLPQSGFAADSRKVSLGRKLFEDKRLSRGDTVSCSSCHNLQSGGADGRARSIGIQGAVGDINAPSVFNSGFNFRQFWDGRAKTLEEQVDGPLQNAKELGNTWDEALAKLRTDPAYGERFARLYADGLTKDNVKDALATFERSLVTPNARFDRFLRGDQSAITGQEKLGYQRFKSYGCVACHQGMNVGGNMFQTMGVMGNYFQDRGIPETAADLGRFGVTGNEQDRHVFRVPSLRNVELTAPYFHDGSVPKLEDAVNIMARYQLGRRLTKEEVSSITAFLKTLTGDAPASARGMAGEGGK